MQRITQNLLIKPKYRCLTTKWCTSTLHQDVMYNMLHKNMISMYEVQSRCSGTYNSRMRTAPHQRDVSREVVDEKRAQLKHMMDVTERNVNKDLTFGKISFVERHTINVLMLYQNELSASGEIDDTDGDDDIDEESLKGKDASPSEKRKNPAPLDAIVNRYFRFHKSVGTNNRRLISQNVYDITRWFLFLSHKCNNEASFLQMRDQIREMFHTWIQFEKSTKEIPVDLNRTKFEKMNAKQKKQQADLTFHYKTMVNDFDMNRIWKRENKEELIRWRHMFQVYLIMKPHIDNLMNKFVFQNNQEKNTPLEVELQELEDDFMQKKLNRGIFHDKNIVFGMEVDRKTKSNQVNVAVPMNIQVSCPMELFRLVVDNYGIQESVRICMTNNTQAPTFGRINPLKCKKDLSQFINMMERRYPELVPLEKCKTSKIGFKFPKRFNVFQFEEYKNGLFEIQDEGSQLISSFVNPKPGDLVLDYCAGAGGKTLSFGYKMNNKGQIYLCDVHKHKLDDAKKRLSRAGISNYQCLVLDQSQIPLAPGSYKLHEKQRNQTFKMEQNNNLDKSSQGAKVKLPNKQLNKLKSKMDWVLLDVPCSGTGTLRRNPELRYKINDAWISELCSLQRKIFSNGIEMMKTVFKKDAQQKHSYLVYSTCSILKQENEEQVEFFLQKYGDRIELIDTFKSIPSFGNMDGFFVAVFKSKQNETKPNSPESNQ